MALFILSVLVAGLPQGRIEEARLQSSKPIHGEETKMDDVVWR